MNARQHIIAILFACIPVAACNSVETRPALQEFRIVDGNGVDKVIYQVEIAADMPSRRRGLMYRNELGVDHAMLLDYQRVEQMAIWMKNTYIPLDLIFIDQHGVIVKIHKGAQPLSTDRIESEGPVRAVLEVNAGQVDSHGIGIGDQIRHASFVTE